MVEFSQALPTIFRAAPTASLSRVTTTVVAALPFRTRSGTVLPFALVGVSLIGVWFAIADHVWTDAGLLIISIVFIVGLLAFAAGLQLMNDRAAIIVTTDAFQLRGVFSEIRLLASRDAVQEIVLTGQNLLLMDAHGRELYGTDRSAWSDRQIQHFGQAAGIPVRRA